jgi:hypothetical protein
MSLEMNPGKSKFRRTARITAILAAAFALAAPGAWAGGHHHNGYSHSSYSVGLNWVYPPPYWGGYYPGYGPAYGPPPGPAWGPSYLSLGYGYGGHGSNYGLSFSIPLYVGPRYAPQPPPPPPAPAVPIASRQADPNCLQVREYQTEIVVGGKSVPAYGNACLQPDGSWKPISGPFEAD